MADELIYAKLINGILVLPPTETATVSNYHTCDELLEKDGYKKYPKSLIELSQKGLTKIVNGEVIDNSVQVEKDRQRVTLQMQIDILDKKRIRAIAEPQIMDEVSGQTWLDYYTQQIVDLRQQIASL